MGTTGRQFGIITNTSGGVASLIVPNGIQSQNSVETAKARDSAGKVTDIVAYSKSKTVTFRGLLNNTEYDFDAGSTITVGSETYLVESRDINETNTNFVEVTITAKLSDSATITAYA